MHHEERDTSQTDLLLNNGTEQDFSYTNKC